MAMAHRLCRIALALLRDRVRFNPRRVRIQEGPFTRPLAIIYKRGRELSPAARKFIEVLTTSNLTPHGQRSDKAEKAERDRAERAERGERHEGGRQERAEKTA